MMTEGSSVHASSVLVGRRAVLIRGPSGSGKSRLAFDLILAGRAGLIPPAVLVADDRALLANRQGQLLVRCPPALGGLLEIRGLGIRRCDHIGEAEVGLVVDLHAPDAARLPPAEAMETIISAVKLRRIPVGRGFEPFPLVAAELTTTSGDGDTGQSDAIAGSDLLTI